MPSPLPVRWSPRAIRELDAIRELIAADRPMAAERLADRLVEAGNRLGDFPEAGRQDGTSRVLVTVRPYAIRYRVRPGVVVIVGVRHGARRR